MIWVGCIATVLVGLYLVVVVLGIVGLAAGMCGRITKSEAAVSLLLLSVGCMLIWVGVTGLPLQIVAK